MCECEQYLVRHHDLGSRVQHHPLGVECGEELVEDLVGNGKEGEVLDVGVVLHRVGHDVVYVVRPLPPPDRDATKHIASSDTSQVVPALWVGGVGVEDELCVCSSMVFRLLALCDSPSRATPSCVPSHGPGRPVAARSIPTRPHQPCATKSPVERGRGRGTAWRERVCGSVWEGGMGGVGGTWRKRVR